MIMQRNKDEKITTFLPYKEFPGLIHMAIGGKVMQDALLDYRRKIQNMSEREGILRDLYLRNVALGKIQGPSTGFPSLDKVHLAFFKEEYIKAPIPFMTAAEYLKKQNKNNLDSIAIDCKEGIITYRELFDHIDQTTASLHKMGVVKGKIIVGMLPADIPHEVYLLYGACQAGSAVSFMIPEAPYGEICKTINDLSADYFFVSNDSFSSDMEECIYENTNIRNIINVCIVPCSHKDKRTMTWREFIEAGKDYQMPQITRSPNDLLFMAKTGGSTGEPKNVMINDNGFNIIVHQLLNSELQYHTGDKWLRLWSLFSASAAISSSHLALCAGMINVLRAMPAPDKFAVMIMEERPNHLCLVSALMDLLIYSGIKKEDIKDFVKTAGIGGESITLQFEERAEKFLPDYLGYGYGCTENSSSAVFRMNKETAIKGKIGIPYVKTIVSAFEPETMEEKRFNEEGEICINSYTQMMGYYHDEQLTREVLRKHSDGSIWIHTGDLGFIDEKGFVIITGRIKRFISVYTGEKVYPTQLENVISKVPGILKVVIVQAPDKEHDEYYVPAACIVADEKYRPERIKENIRAVCEKQLPQYAQPRDIVIVKDFPYLASGKPNLKKIEQMFL